MWSMQRKERKEFYKKKKNFVIDKIQREEGRKEKKKRKRAKNSIQNKLGTLELFQNHAFMNNKRK